MWAQPSFQLLCTKLGMRQSDYPRLILGKMNLPSFRPLSNKVKLTCVIAWPVQLPSLCVIEQSRGK